MVEGVGDDFFSRLGNDEFFKKATRPRGICDLGSRWLGVEPIGASFRVRLKLFEWGGHSWLPATFQVAAGPPGEFPVDTGTDFLCFRMNVASLIGTLPAIRSSLRSVCMEVYRQVGCFVANRSRVRAQRL